MNIRIKELLNKAQKGEDLTEEELKAIDELDTTLDDKEEDERANELAEKMLAILESKMAGKAPEVTNEQEVSKKAFDSMSKEEKRNAFFKAVIKNDQVSLKYMNEGSNENGGYTVPAETFSEIVNNLKETTVMRANARVIPNCPAHLDVTALSTLPTAHWRGEAAKKQSSTMLFGTQALTPYSVAVLVVLTNELKSDSMIDIADFVIQAMVESLTQEEESVFASGNGTGQPTGLEQYFAAYPAARKVLNATLTDLGDRIMTADTRLKKQYRPRAKWYMPTGQLEKIRLLRDGNTGQFIFQPDPTGEFVGRICGKPVEINDNLTNIWFGDLQGYWIGQREGITIAQSTEATIGTTNLFENNMFAIRVEERVDGELVDNKALIAVEAEA